MDDKKNLMTSDCARMIDALRKNYTQFGIPREDWDCKSGGLMKRPSLEEGTGFMAYEHAVPGRVYRDDAGNLKAENHRMRYQGGWTWRDQHGRTFDEHVVGARSREELVSKLAKRNAYRLSDVYHRELPERLGPITWMFTQYYCYALYL